MPVRTLSFLAVIALVLAACARGDAADSTTTTVGATTTQPVPEAMQLSYTLEPDTTFTYEVDLSQQIDMTTEGDAEAAGDEQMPGAMSITLDGTTTFTHTVAEGPEPGTFEVTIQGEFTDLTVEGTVDGEPADSREVPDLADIPPIDVTFVVDEQGNVISEETDSADPLGGLGGLGGFGDLESLAQGTELGRLVGPPLPEEQVTVGDTWTDTTEIPMGLSADVDPITTEMVSEVVGTESVAGVEHFVIETVTTTSMIEFDLAEFLIGFFGAFLPDDASEEDQAELDALLEDLRFFFTIDEATGNMTTLFDADAGVSRRADVESLTHMVMDVNVPDETTGQMMGFVLDMTIDQSVQYRLVSGTGA